MSKWEMVKLGDVCSLITDGTHQTPTYSENGYIFLSSKNVTSGRIDWENVKYIPYELHEQLNKRLAPQFGDILLAKNGTTGVCAVVDRDIIFDIYVSLALLRPNDCIKSSYFVHALNNPYTKRRFNTHLKGIGVPNLHLNSIKETAIPLPPLEVQEKIAHTLDTVSDLIKMYKEQLEQLDLLVKSQFVEMFGDLYINNYGWRILKFNEYATIDTNMVKDFDKYADYPHIGIDSIEKDTGELKGYRTVKEDGVTSGKYLFTPNHIIYSKIRPNLNKVALPTFSGVCSADAYPILVKDEICNKYFITYALRSEVFLSYILAFSSRTNLPKVNKEQISGFCLPVPPLPLQNKFAEFVAKVEEQKAEVKKALEQAQTLYNALMQDYFE